MQRLVDALAITLHLRPYRETSVLLDLWLRDQGRCTAVARGVRAAGKARRQAELSPLSVNLVELFGSGQVLSLRAHDNQRQFLIQHPVGLRSAMYLNELILRLLPEHDPHPELFDRYLGMLQDWSGQSAIGAESLAVALRLFEAALLEDLGYGLVFDHTVDGEPVLAEQSYQVDPEQGVVMARRGLDWPVIDGRSLLLLQRAEPAQGLASRGLRDLMRALLRFRLGGRTLRAWTF
ncbi:DNA repair protein RecO [Ahniella affigens]|uniref:DNA repair protein RecO n=1 Tax=Ahniella affigens TaxID=2021234 RepID=A0A2P1PSJ2_9GAMM|nr:DNA repair protein RecO [Ahniella affigens]AVP97800.1 DNA repair protein RecO [Ahniella affigens]